MILQSYVNIELAYHAKALEYFTKCRQSLDAIDEEEDLEVTMIFSTLISTSL